MCASSQQEEWALVLEKTNLFPMKNFLYLIGDGDIIALNY